jgi:hypothetical protein
MIYATYIRREEFLNFSMQAAQPEISICAKFWIKVQKYDFPRASGPVQGYLANRHIENYIASPSLRGNPNLFRVSSTTLCTIY